MGLCEGGSAPVVKSTSQSSSAVQAVSVSSGCADVVSTGVRFTTLPATPGKPASPPTTISVLYNPLIGFVSASYAAQISPTVSAATRFGVNIYSYDSDFAIGGEWWIGRRRGKRAEVELSPEDKDMLAKHKAVGGRLRDDPEDLSTPTVELEAEELRQLVAGPNEDERNGVVKARLSGNWSLALLYESRIRNCLVSVGLVSDLLGGTGKAIKSVGLEVQYYS